MSRSRSPILVAGLAIQDPGIDPSENAPDRSESLSRFWSRVLGLSRGVSPSVSVATTVSRLERLLDAGSADAGLTPRSLSSFRVSFHGTGGPAGPPAWVTSLPDHRWIEPEVEGPGSRPLERALAELAQGECDAAFVFALAPPPPDPGSDRRGPSVDVVAVLLATDAAGPVVRRAHARILAARQERSSPDLSGSEDPPWEPRTIPGFLITSGIHSRSGSGGETLWPPGQYPFESRKGSLAGRIKESVGKMWGLSSRGSGEGDEARGLAAGPFRDPEGEPILMPWTRVEDLPVDPTQGSLLALAIGALALATRTLPGSPEGTGTMPDSAGAEADPRFYHPRQSQPWIHPMLGSGGSPHTSSWSPADAPRQAGIRIATSAPGDLLVLLEETPDLRSALEPAAPQLPWDGELIIVSADSPGALRGKLESLRRGLAPLPAGASPDTIARQLRGPGVLGCSRWITISSDIEGLRTALDGTFFRLRNGQGGSDQKASVWLSEDAGRPRGRLVCMFPGLGPPGLVGPYGKQLFDAALHFPEIRSILDRVEDRDRDPADPRPTSHLLSPPDHLPAASRYLLNRRLDTPRQRDAAWARQRHTRNFAPLVVLAANQGNWQVLSSFGLQPDALFGLSLGDVSALIAAGSLDFETLLELYWRLPENLNEFYAEGHMLMVFASREVIDPYLASVAGVTYAFCMSRTINILAGESEALEHLANRLRGEGLWTNFAPYAAVHTPRFGVLQKILMERFLTLKLAAGNTPVYSGTLAAPLPQDPVKKKDALMDNLSAPIRVWESCERMYQDGFRFFLQVGGGASLHDLARLSLPGDAVTATMFSDDCAPTRQIQIVLAMLLTFGIPLDLTRLDRSRPPAAGPPLDPGTSDDLARRFQDPPSASPAMEERHDGELPFLGETLEFEPGVRIRVQRVLSLSEDRHLADHILVNAIGVKPALACLPILPLTVGLEAMAEVAACLAPGLGLTGFADVRATRWIALVDTDRLLLTIHGRVLDRGDSEVQVEAEIWPEGATSPALRARVLLGTGYAVRIQLTDVEPVEFQEYPHPAEAFYRDRLLFHGPRLRCVKAVTEYSTAGIEGVLEVLARDDLFARNREPQLLCDPVILDGLGQLVGLWANPSGRYVFPIAVDALDIYGPSPSPGTRILARVRIVEESTATIRADIEVEDGQGHVWMRVSGWQTWNFRWTSHWQEFSCDPPGHTISVPLTHPELPPGCVLVLLDGRDVPRLDLELAELTVLDGTEMGRYRDLASDPRRQREWLLGRIAAKDAARILIRAGRPEPMLHPASLRVGNHASGQPWLEHSVLGTLTPRLSISHSKDRAVAMAAHGRVGVDIEHIGPRPPGFLELSFTPAELLWLSHLPGDQLDLWVTLLWAAKEAAIKSLDSGVPVPPRVMETRLRDEADSIGVSLPDAEDILVRFLTFPEFVVAWTAR